jgi:hypothetical protein
VLEEDLRMLHSVYLYFGHHYGSDEVSAIDDWLQLLKRSVLLFDEVFISDQVTARVVTQQSVGFLGWSKDDAARISGELKAVQPDELRVLRELPGAGEGKVIATASEVVKQVNLSRVRPTTKDEERSWDAITRMVNMKFHGDPYADTPLSEYIQGLNFSYSDLLDELVSSNLDSPLHKSSLDALVVKKDEGSLSLAVLNELLCVRVPSFGHLPLDEILDLRAEPGWVQLRLFIEEVTSKIKEALLAEQPVESDIVGLIDHRLLSEISSELLAGKTSAREVALSYLQNLIGLIPYADYVVTLCDLGVETQRFLNDRKHWLTFLSRVEKHGIS